MRERGGVNGRVRGLGEATRVVSDSGCLCRVHNGFLDPAGPRRRKPKRPPRRPAPAPSASCGGGAQRGRSAPRPRGARARTKAHPARPPSPCWSGRCLSPEGPMTCHPPSVLPLSHLQSPLP